MAASVLGKRARATESSKGVPSLSSCRIKRRAILSPVNDENDDPSISQNEQNRIGCDGILQCDESEDHLSTPSKSRKFGVRSPGRPRAIAASPDQLHEYGNTSNQTSKDRAKIWQPPTPQTPRHRDALSKKTPITPRHRVILFGTPSTPRTPRTPITPNNAPTIYKAARQLFTSSADPGRLVGREEERNQLQIFIQTGIRSRSGQCLYVSGPPGTGKSALVAEVCRDLQATPNVRMAHINCMVIKSSRDIFSKLIDELNGEDEKHSNDDVAQLQAIFMPKKNSSGPLYVVTLDEIDHLLTLGSEILYKLFEWSLHRSSRLILIGIANALDLTDRFLPRLKARNLKPQLLPFLPYTAPQIASVITTKLQTLSQASPHAPLDHIPFVHPAAVQFCSKKVASQTGDLRKAFDIMRRTIDLVESETKQKHQSGMNTQIHPASPSKVPLKENLNLSSPITGPEAPEPSISLLSPLTAPRATIAHVARISASTLSNGTPQRLKTLNLQQKAALCTLISHEKSTRRRYRSVMDTPSKTSATDMAPSIRQLYDTYRTLCKRENSLHPLTATEFADVIGGLETLGLVGEGMARGFLGKETPSRKKRMGGAVGEERRMICWVSEEEVEGCLEGVGGAILRGLLMGDD